ncbi:zf-HC2 domain-containing protein [Paraburkholderia lycopersici]|uniref:Transmembrane transcriptional regulator (Anti-sigma factor RsiW) n=1 Tax=Paraburkholderia lycopersici TaxID=416944 RepID=A0A1G6L148_9BURK|nr:zf-HC2 domain-containing protein [Paraburkholderia lycopersici]SDC36913.1 Transmembrane transcriptional regulator (anti-sigma factor RsiW) [Paraburkholderia lycopersici]
MNCNEARPLVDASVDRELSAADEWRVREHLASCAACRRAADEAQAISRMIRCAPYHRPPAGLAARIVASLPATEDAPAMASRSPSRARGPSGWRAWLRDRLQGGQAAGGGGAGGWSAPADGAGPRAATLAWFGCAALVLCALAVIAALHLRRPAAEAAFVDDLVSSHVRAQISGRDLDVISTDRHTVKPWFNGRIDYAPPVFDLAQQGFALAGGRLDYVGRERVAVLVYHYRKHVIDVYVFPPGASGSVFPGGAATHTSEGYALERWQAAGMTWWAVTDAGADALDGLRAALDARLSAGASETAGG